MDRMSKALEPIRDEVMTAKFQRTLANWAGDLLAHAKPIRWPESQPASDYRNRDWKSLYSGSVMDD